MSIELNHIVWATDREASAGSLAGIWASAVLLWLGGGFPLAAWRHPLKGEEFSDGRVAQEVRP
jgi:hypothetical protein